MADLIQTVEVDPAQMTDDELLDYACQVRAGIKALEASKAAIDDELSRRFEAGEIDSNFTHNDWTFAWCEGRAKWTYPAAVKALEAGVKAAKEASEADGTATRSTGAPYWTIREPRT